MEKRKTVSALIHILIIIIVVSGIILPVYHQKEIYPFGDNTTAYGDMVQQTIPENLYYMWDVLHGKANAFFTWNSGFGLNISGAASEQAFLSPLNLFILFSSRDNLANFVNILLILKIICIAIAMFLYLNKYKMDSLIKTGASILYAFGAASLIYCQIMFVMDMAFLLPLLMIGYDRIFSKRKCGVFIAVCSLCLIENIYMSFMVLLFVLIIGGLHVICSEKSREEKGGYTFLLGVSVVISLMLSAVVTVPAMSSILESSRIGKSFLETYTEALSSSWTVRDWETAKYLLINLAFPAAAGIYSFVFRKAGKKYEKKQLILILLLLMPFAVNGTELLWHGGSRNWWPIRFVFLISFAAIDFLMQFLQKTDFQSAGKKQIWCVPAVLAGLICSKIVYNVFERAGDINSNREIICMIITCFCVLGYYFLLSAEKKRVSLAVFFIIFEVSSMTRLFLAPDMYNTNEYDAAVLKDMQTINNNMEETGPFERIKNSDGGIYNVNYSLVMGRESLANYIHVIDASFQPLLVKWGYSVHWTRLLDTGGTIFSDTLFGVKYTISSREQPELLFDRVAECQGSRGNYYIYANKYEIPLISYIDNNTGELSGDIFNNQNMIFRSTTGYQGNLIEEYTDIRIGETANVQLEGKKALYFYGNGNQSLTVRVNGEDVAVPGRGNLYNYSYPSDFNSNLLFLGCYEDQTVSIDFLNANSANGIHLGILDLDVFEEGINRMNSVLQGNVTFERNNTGVQIELNSVRAGSIFVPVLYDEGWSCKVNGSKTEVGEAYGFIKVDVRQGENQIYLKYTPKGRFAGGMITMIGAVAGAAFLGLYCRRTHGKLFGLIYRASYLVFVAVFGGMMILFYLIPAMKYFEQLLIQF